MGYSMRTICSTNNLYKAFGPNDVIIEEIILFLKLTDTHNCN